MRGSPSAPLVAVRDRLNDWTPRLFPRGKSLNRKSWCCARPNTWLVEPQGLPSKVIEIQQASLGRLAMKNGLQLWNEAQKNTLIFVLRSIVEVAGAESRVKMNAKVRRP